MLLYFVLSVEFCAAVALPAASARMGGRLARPWTGCRWSVQHSQTLGRIWHRSGGLLWAYARAARFREEKWPRILDQVRKLSYALRGGGPVITGTWKRRRLQPLECCSRVAEGAGTFSLVTRNLNASRTRVQRQLEDVIDRLIAQDIPPIMKDINDLKSGVKESRSLAKSEAENALAKAREGIADLHRDLDRTQTLDLRAAIGGLFISAWA